MEEVRSQNNEDLQKLIVKSIQERKALLCLVFDATPLSKTWEAQIIDLRHYRKLKDTTICVKMESKSTQAQLLSAVCPIQNTPAVIIVQNGQSSGNYQNGQPSSKNFVEEIHKRYRLTEQEIQEALTARDLNAGENEGCIASPPSSGRMRLPNNAYDKFRCITDEYLAQGLEAKYVAGLQLRILKATGVNIIKEAADTLEDGGLSINGRQSLPDAAIDKLLNSPPSIFNDDLIFLDNMTTDGSNSYFEFVVNKETETRESSSSNAPLQALPAPSAPLIPSQTNTSIVNDRSQNASPQSQPQQPASSTQATQRLEYIRQQRERESAQKAERERIKAQIRADRDARREAETQRKAAERQSELESLRKANSTTTNPQSSDIRIQVRTFDGSTIKTTFSKTATIGKDVRPWVDENKESREPYDLKLILTPLPNRNIEAGEEEQQLSDLGIKGSCTMVMVPVKGFVDSYGGNTSGSLIGSAVSGGFGLVSGAAGMLFGGVRSLLGGVGGTQPDSGQQPEREPTQGTPTSGGSGGNSGNNMRVRTLADQRMEESKKNNHQLYNGNQLNFEPRKDEDEEFRKRD